MAQRRGWWCIQVDDAGEQDPCQHASAMVSGRRACARTWTAASPSNCAAELPPNQPSRGSRLRELQHAPEAQDSRRASSFHTILAAGERHRRGGHDPRHARLAARQSARAAGGALVYSRPRPARAPHSSPVRALSFFLCCSFPSTAAIALPHGSPFTMQLDCPRRHPWHSPTATPRRRLLRGGIGPVDFGSAV